jgi:hypothetical protein
MILSKPINWQTKRRFKMQVDITKAYRFKLKPKPMQRLALAKERKAYSAEFESTTV